MRLVNLGDFLGCDGLLRLGLIWGIHIFELPLVALTIASISN